MKDMIVYAVMRGTELKSLHDTEVYAAFVAAQHDRTFPRGRRHSVMAMRVQKDPVEPTSD
jgi:hypothetical protein